MAAEKTEPNVVERTVGVSWRTSVSGYMETLCLVVILLTALPADVWRDPRVWVPVSLGIIAKTVKDSLTKDKAVTGGTIESAVPVERVVKPAPKT